MIDRTRLRRILESVKNGAMSIDDAMTEIDTVADMNTVIGGNDSQDMKDHEFNLHSRWKDDDNNNQSDDDGYGSTIKHFQ